MKNSTAHSTCSVRHVVVSLKLVSALPFGVSVVLDYVSLSWFGPTLARKDLT